MYLTINGIRLNVDVQEAASGGGARGGARPAIYGHHGAPGLGTHATPKRALAPLADSYKIVTLDARG